MTNNTGKIIQIISAVVDVQFTSKSHLPKILNALECDNNGNKVILEVAQHIGDNIARCISMHPTDGLVRSQSVVDTGNSITVPVGVKTLGRIINVTGDRSY